jgi:hypothetical protein
MAMPVDSDLQQGHCHAMRFARPNPWRKNQIMFRIDSPVPIRFMAKVKKKKSKGEVEGRGSRVVIPGHQPHFGQKYQPQPQGRDRQTERQVHRTTRRAPPSGLHLL